MAGKNPNKLFPLVVTEDLKATRAFYKDVCGARVTIDMDGYLQVRFGDAEDAPELCFMTPDSMPEGPTFPRFDGKGVFMSVPTANADQHHDVLVSRGAKPSAPPSSKPWGWRSFLVSDPNGLVLDFFHVEKDNPLIHASS